MFVILRHFKPFWVAFISIVEFAAKGVTVSSRSKDYFLVLVYSKYERSFNLEAISDVKISHSLFRDLLSQNTFFSRYFTKKLILKMPLSSIFAIFCGKTHHSPFFLRFFTSKAHPQDTCCLKSLSSQDNTFVIFSVKTHHSPFSRDFFIKKKSSRCLLS